MALVSPGVQVTVIDESFYTPAEPGTTPLIIIATAQDKPNAAGTATAAGTTAANAGKAFRITSQRELVETFGVPFFEKTASSTPIHGSERNEYGLLAAYSLLGVSNSVFITRADINLDELEAAATEPGSEPVDQQWWVDTAATLFGIQEWNGAAPTVTGGQKFSTKTPIVLTDDDDSKTTSGAPRSSVGSVGDYAVVAQTAQGGTSAFDAARETITYWYKSAGGTYALASAVEAGQWVKLGSPEWKASHYVAITTSSGPYSTAGSSIIKINGNPVTVSQNSTPTQLAAAVNAIGIVQGFSAKVVGGKVAFFTDGEDSDPAEDSTATESGGLVFENVSGTVFGTGVVTDPDPVKNGDTGIVLGLYRAPALQMTPHTQVPIWKTTQSPRPTGSVWIKTTTPNAGADYVIKKWDADLKVWTRFTAPLYATTHNANYYLDRTGGGLGIAVDSLFVQYNVNEGVGNPKAELRVWRRATAGQTVITSAVVNDTTFDFNFTTYSNIATYNEGDIVKYTDGKYYTCIFNGTSGVVPTNTANWQRTEMGFFIEEGITGDLALGDLTRVAFYPKAYASTADAGVGTDNAEAFAAAINGAGFSHVEASVTSDQRIRIVHKAGGDFRVTDDTDPAQACFDRLFAAYDLSDGSDTENLYETPGYASGTAWFASNWRPLVVNDYRASATQPLEEPQDGQLWYNPNFSEVDIMAHNGEIWVGLNNHEDYASSEVIVAASEPVLTLAQKSIANHLWISTADLENFPTIYRWNVNDSEWALVDKTDQTTEDGVLFADARYNTSGADSDVAGALADLLTSNYVDPDCPDPALYPRGMLLWNLRRSGGNVKRYSNNYINVNENNVRYRAGDNEPAPTGTSSAPPAGESMANYATDRWTTASANNEDGSGSFGRKAQRKVIVSAMKSITDTSEEIRDEERRNFNLIAAPGYPELLSNLINLNIDRGLTAFVIGDTPLRLKSDATTLTTWGTNANLVFDNGDDGIVSYDEYCAVYYPNGFTTDLSGSNAVVPASHMMLRTIALSDSVSYPWFAPAGTRRGGITNATAVGYIDALTGEFQTVALNEGQRDTLYDLKVNPIPFFVGVGHVAYGQKTRARNASALDRINVARLVVYLRSQLNKLARPYIFEPNDKITRDEIRGAVESLLLELVGLRAIYDFAVVCDESNNTPARIDRNELWVDVAIEPVKAVEFIYIPLRLKNTGEI